MNDLETVNCMAMVLSRQQDRLNTLLNQLAQLKNSDLSDALDLLKEIKDELEFNNFALEAVNEITWRINNGI